LTRDEVAARLIATADSIDDVNAGFYAKGATPEMLPDRWGLEGLMGSGRVNAARAVDQTESLPPPWIEQVRVILDESDDPWMVSVELGSVFKGPEFTLDGNGDVTSVTPSPVDDLDNWQLVYDGNDDGDFDDTAEPNPDDIVVQLVPEYWDSDYTNLTYDDGGQTRSVGYMVGTNSVQFSVDWGENDLLLDGRYRLTAFGQDVDHPDGLVGPDDQPLDGNGDGPDYMRDFYVGTPAATTTITIPAAAQSVTLRPLEDHPEWLEIVDGVNNPQALLMEMVDLTINVPDDVPVTVEHLPYACEMRLRSPDAPDVLGRITINAGGGSNNTITLAGSGGDDTFRGYHHTAELTAAGGVIEAAGFQQVTVETFGGAGKAHLYHNGLVGTLDAADDWAKLSHEAALPEDDWSNKAVGFDTVYVHQTGDGGDVPDLLDFNLLRVDRDNVFFWDEDAWWAENGDRYWHEDQAYPEDTDNTRWLLSDGDTSEDYPFQDFEDAIIDGGRVTISQPPADPATIELDDLKIVDVDVVAESDIEIDGELTLAGGSLIASQDTLALADLIFSHGQARIDVGSGVTVTGAVSTYDSLATLIVDGTFAFNGNDAEYICRIGDMHNNWVAGIDGVTLDGTLDLKALDVRQSEIGTTTTRTIVQAGVGQSVTGTFDEVPPVTGDASHVGVGVFHRGVVYQQRLVTTDLYVAVGGDGNGDTNVDGQDITNLLNNLSQPGDPPDRVWTQNDTAGGPVSRGDGIVDGQDITDLISNFTGDPGPLMAGGGGPEGASAGYGLNLEPEAWDRAIAELMAEPQSESAIGSSPAAVIKYDPTAGTASVSIDNVLSWTLTSDGRFDPIRLAAVDNVLSRDAGDLTLISANRNTIGEASPLGAISYPTLYLGRIVEPGTPVGELTFAYVTGYGQAVQQGTVIVTASGPTDVAAVLYSLKALSNGSDANGEDEQSDNTVSQLMLTDNTA